MTLRLFRIIGEWFRSDMAMIVNAPVTMPVAEEAQVRELHRLLKLGTPALVGPGDERVDLPESVYTILKEVVRNMQLGRSVTILPEKEDLTTQKVADLLSVSRPHVVKLLESGEIPFHKSGSHRRVYLKDALDYSKRSDAARRRILAAIAKRAYDEGLYSKASIPAGGDDE